MTFSMKVLGTLTAAMFLTTGLAIAGPEKDPLPARVPADKRGEAKKDKSPYTTKLKMLRRKSWRKEKLCMREKGPALTATAKKAMAKVRQEPS